MNRIVLKPKKEAAVKRFHPWVFSGAVQRLEGQPEDGDIVEVCDHQGDPLAIGHYQKGSITVRIFSFQPAEITQPFWTSKIAAALHYRKALDFVNQEQTNCYRLVNAEGDGLPGLIIDIYDRTAVVQCHSIGMHRQLKDIRNALQEVYGQRLEAIFDKSAETLPSVYAAGVRNGYLSGKPTHKLVRENGHAFLVDWESGQKTGFFLDQRDNRKLLAAYARDKTILNAYCYSGGFSVYALRAGARHVDSVDSSAKAVDLTRQNVALNQTGAGAHQAHQDDVIRCLSRSTAAYDLIIVDPPAFAKTLSKRHNAVQGYKRLNALAFGRLRPGGILFSFSCSQVVDKQLFDNTVVAAAHEAGRTARIMHHLGQAPDHPVSLFHPEGSYLKGLVLFVD